MVTQDMNAQNMNAMPMGERLVAAGLLSERDLERARLAKREMGCMLGEALVRLGLVAEANVVKYLGEELDIPIAEKPAIPMSPLSSKACVSTFCSTITLFRWRRQRAALRSLR